MVTLISDGGTMTVGRRTASFTWGSFDVVLPEGTEQQQDDGRLVDGYIYRPDDRGRGRGELTFVRADARIDMNGARSDLEDTLDQASRRTEGAIFYTREVSGLGLGRKIPGVDYTTGDIVDVLVWGKRIALPVTGLRRRGSTDRGRYDAVQVGGQALSDPDRQRKLNSDLDRQIAAEKRQRLKEAGEIRDTANTAKETANTAKETAGKAKDAADVALTGMVMEYAVGTSEDFPPTSGWSTSTPDRPSGSFIWMRTRITSGSGSTEVTSPVLITGNTGGDGEDGTPGKDGLGIQTTTVLYAVGPSGTSAPASGWSAQVPALVQGQYLWTRTIWTYTDGTSETGHSVAYLAKDGADGDDGLPGKDGVGIASTVNLYAVSNSGTVAPTSEWVATPPAAAPGQFMWTRTIWTYTDGTTEVGYSIGKIGETGQPGQDGVDGADGLPGRDGVGLRTTAVAYAVSSSGTVAPSSGWTSTVPPLVQGQYLWTRTTWTYTNDSTETGYSVAYLSKDGSDGEDGLPGKDGVGITDTVIEYARSTSGTTPPSTGWGAQPPSTSPGDYVWTRHTWHYTDGTTETGHTVGKIGDTGPPGLEGEQGIPGDPGVDGRPSYTHIAYADTAAGAGFSQSPAGKAYMGVYVDDVPLDSSDPARYRWSLIKGADGEKGVPGAKGSDGRTPYFHTAWADSPDGTVGFSTTDSEGKKFLGTYTDYSTTDVYMDRYMDSYGVSAEPDSTDPARYDWVQIKGDKGDDGLPGKDGVGLVDTVVEYALSSGGTVAPSSGWSQIVPTLTKGSYLWTRTTWHYSDESTEVGHSVSYIPVDGSNGTDGLPGKDGVGITDTVISYAKSSSGTVPPTGGWSDQPPATAPGDFVWTRTVWSYSDGTDETGFTVGKIGDTGEKGDPGQKGDPGDPGADGRGIASTATAYVASASGTVTPGTGWTSSIPVVPEGHHLWTRTTLTFTDGATSVSYAVSRQGVDGENGTPGDPGADGKTSYFHTAYANSSDGVSGFSTTDPTGRTYVGTYSDFTEADSTDPSTYVWQLVRGADGAPGKGVDTVTITYAASSSGTQAPATGWESAIPAVPQGHFLWTRTLTRFTDGAATTVDMVARQGIDGEKGTPGIPGHDGRTPFLHVAYANSPNGTVDFSTTDPSGRAYLGTYTDFATLDIHMDVYADSYGTSVPLDSTDPTRYSWALIKGTDGIDGVDGSDGVSVTGVDVFFRQVPKGSIAPAVPTTATPTGWSTTEPAWAGDKDLYQTTRIRYSSGDFAYTPPSKVGAYDAANAAWAAATDADGELAKKVKAAQDAAAAAEGAFEDVDGLINAPEGDFRRGVQAAFWAQDQVNDDQSEFNQAVSQTATNALATSRLAFPHVSITPVDPTGQPYWSYGASASTLTPDKSSVAGDLSTYSWRHTGAIPGGTVAEAYFDVTPGIDLKLNLMTYMSSGSTSGIYVGFVDETGANAVEQWKDLSTSGGAWIESAEMGFPTVVGTWTPGVGIFRLKPGVRKARPVVRTLTAITVWGMHLAAWFPLAEDLQAETAARLNALEELRGVGTEVSRLGERVAELESGEDFRHLGARRGRLVRDTGYVNISWPSDKRATFTWVAGENLDVTFRINYENNTVIEDSFNTVEDFLGQWSMSLGSDSGSTNIRSASATYRRKPGQVKRFSQTAPQQYIPKSTWFQPSGTSDTGVTGPMGWSAGATPVRMIATLEVEWRWATAEADYGIAWFVNGVAANYLVQTNLGPRWFWEDGRRTQKLEFSGTLPPNAVLTPVLWSSSGGDAPDANQRLITFAKAEYFTIT